MLDTITDGYFLYTSTDRLLSCYFAIFLYLFLFVSNYKTFKDVSYTSFIVGRIMHGNSWVAIIFELSSANTMLIQPKR